MQRWSLEISANPGIVTNPNSPHFYFWSGDTEFGDVDPWMSSLHTKYLDESETDRAYYRLLALFHIVNGSRIILGEATIYFMGLRYASDSGVYFQKSPINDFQIMLEEFSNPFEEKVLNEIEESKKIHKISSMTFYLEESVRHEDVREALMLISLSELNPITFFVNSYKIYDTIRFDIKESITTKKGKKREGDYKELVHEELKSNFERLSRSTGCMNNWGNSKILARHGNKGLDSQKIICDFEEIKKDVLSTLREWMKYRKKLSRG